ncbi:MAG: SDR family NAD(P)-dependent oxidoreductase, partial [Arenicellales bacterium]
MRLKDKTAFATAAGAGIGRASALAMAREGARVFATDVDEPALELLSEESPNITAFVMDAQDADA